MGRPKEHREATCKMDVAMDSRLRDRLPSVAEKIIENCTDTGCFTHVDFEPIPSKQSVIEIIEKLREVIERKMFSNTEDLLPVIFGRDYGFSSDEIHRQMNEHHDKLLY